MNKFIITFFITLIAFNFQTFAKPKKVSVAENLLRNEDPDAGTLFLSRFVANIDESKPHLGIIKVGGFCAKHSDFDLNDRKAEYNSEMFREAFDGVLSELNYNLAGYTTDLFDDTPITPDFRVAAMLTDMEVDMCFYENQWERAIVEGATVYMNITWQVRDEATEKTVYRGQSEGYFQQKKKVKNGFEIALKGAFAAATKNMLADNKLVNVVKSENIVVATDAEFEALNIDYILSDNNSEERGLDTLNESVVGIKTPAGTGSGFIISSSGHILTNHHVIEGFDNATIILANGMEIEGQVLRSAKIRDVALLKVPLSKLKPLTIEAELPKVGSKSFAIGSPLGVENQGTLSSGIISNIRDWENDYKMIQSDTSITFGNSGGAMTNEKGHVIAISQGGHGGNGDFINYFVPIQSALTVLNIQQSDYN